MIVHFIKDVVIYIVGCLHYMEVDDQRCIEIINVDCDVAYICADHHRIGPVRQWLPIKIYCCRMSSATAPVVSRVRRIVIRHFGSTTLLFAVLRLKIWLRRWMSDITSFWGNVDGGFSRSSTVSIHDYFYVGISPSRGFFLGRALIHKSVIMGRRLSDACRFFIVDAFDLRGLNESPFW